MGKGRELQTHDAVERRPIGLTALSVFFVFGTVMSGLAWIALLSPGGTLEPLWRLNPEARVGFARMGPWAIVLMFVVSIACALSAWGLWIRAPWGRRLAVTILAVNLIGDGANTVLRGDLRTLIGLPIGGALIVYLLSSRIRSQFTAAPRRCP